MKKDIKNKPESIRARLFNISKSEKIDFDIILLRYFQERFLYRLSISEFKDNFVLKGGLLLSSLKIPKTRATIDIDFLAQKVRNDPEEIKNDIAKIAGILSDDGVVFDISEVTYERIREDADYEGVRCKITGRLGQARRKLQIDTGFGDVITPSSVTLEMPILLDNERPKLKVYSIETVISEKLEAMVKLSFINTRMKDFYDIYIISRSCIVNNEILTKAITTTFKIRNTEIPENIVIFSPEFYLNEIRQRQWIAFLNKSRLQDINMTFPEVIEQIKVFLQSVISGIVKKRIDTSVWDNVKNKWVKK